ncbi:pentapeptide repeat-containing protein [Actinotalea sp. BY-33]|uniref:Pentapeptide repeat-containing protein n=1 Tax=Actinotalea soli TaxID=2819234 RepID=A0A939RXE6_9CELL|nr:pentapeptide repeat-containing protein [Actinotalea soli]MBO1753146.1 pentapeptide repeat-containing protein [Actinotalea soli]
MPHREPFTGPLEPGADVDLASLEDLDLTGQDATGATLVDCALVRCRLDGVRMSHARLVDTVLEQVTAGELHTPDAAWQGVELLDCRLGAVQAYGSTWTRVTLRGGKTDYLNLRGARITDLRIDGVVLGDLDLGDATVKRLTITGSRIGRLALHRSTLTEVDLRGADLSGIEGVDGLAGATISEQQLLELAPAMADHLRIAVT